MKDISQAIARWLEEKRRKDRALATVLAVLALGSGTVVFLVATLFVYTALSIVRGAFFNSIPSLILVASGHTAGIFVLSIKGRRNERQLGLDPLGLWILKDICSIGPRLILEGSRQVRCFGQLGELNVEACACALTYLAAQNAAVNWEDLVQHCPRLPPARLREQLSLLDGVLFLGEDAARVTLMDPFRIRLRWMLGREPGTGKPKETSRPGPEPRPQAVPVNEPEKLSAYAILGLSPSATVVEIRAAYRKRVKECHPDLFTGMDQQAKVLAERWTKALNAAYATLKPRRANDTSNSAGRHAS